MLTCPMIYTKSGIESQGDDFFYGMNMIWVWVSIMGLNFSDNNLQ